jgi:hypothetical protein
LLLASLYCIYKMDITIPNYSNYRELCFQLVGDIISANM